MRRYQVAGRALLGLIALSTNAFAAPGDLDPSFDGDGRVVFDLGEATVSPSDMLLQPDGKIVTLAATPGRVDSEANRDFLIARFNGDGSLDTSFNRVGYKLMANDGQVAVAGGLALQSDGKLIVTGATLIGGDQDFFVARLNADGSFDTAFGTQGSTTISFGGPLERAWRAAVQSDGNIIVAGMSNGAGTTDFAIARLTPTGALDASFGAQGKVQVDSLLGVTDALNALTLQADGKIVVAGAAGATPAVNRPFIVRLNSNGSLDTGFDADGRFLPIVQPTFAAASISAIAQQSDGRLLAAGYAIFGSVQMAGVMRVAADGSVDEPIALVNMGGFSSSALDMALEPGGSFLVGGAYPSGPFGFVTRFSSFGTPDPAFGTNGASFIHAGRDNAPYNFYAARIARQSDGRVVVLGGTQTFQSDPEPALRRRLMVARLGPAGGSSPGTLGLMDRAGARTIDEGALDTFSVVRAGGAAGAVSVTYTLTPVTADAGTDFPALTGTLTWNDGESGAKTVGYVPAADGVYEPTHEEMQIVLSNFTGGATPSNTIRRVFIRSMDAAPTPRISMNRTAVDKHEEHDFGNVNVFWTGWNLAGVTATVDYSVILGTAIDGLDTVVSTGTITLTNANSGTISIPNIVDATDEAIKTFTIRLSNATGGVTIDQADTVVSLIDNDPPPFIELKESTRTVSESASSMTFTVTRTAHSAEELRVDYSTQGGTATSGDFVATNGTLIWAANDYTPKTFTVTLSPDTTVEGAESFSVALSNATTGAALGHATANVTITDDDVAPPPAPSGGGGGPLDILSLFACAGLLWRWRLHRRQSLPWLDRWSSRRYRVNSRSLMTKFGI